MQRFNLPVGEAHVFYPEANDERCAAALLLDIDPVGLVRRARGGSRFTLGQYVNDRPYAASSFMSVALVSVFKSAMAGASEERPELAASAMPLVAELPAVPARGGPDLVERLFEPLGYQVEAERLPLDPAFPQWGGSRHVALRLQGELRLAELLTHLYVLLPVLDDDKHYWVGDDEIEKLLRRGEGWLPTHPERELISRRYLKHQSQLYREALLHLTDEGEVEEPAQAVAEVELEERVSLREQRLGSVESVLKAASARRVLDLGCGEGALLQRLLRDGSFEQLTGADVSTRALEVAERRLKLDRLPEAKRERVSLLQSALTYRDRRLAGYDAAVLMEVIEHLDPPRLAACEQNVFGNAQPATVVVTTPNSEYNVKFDGLRDGGFRHPDHRFEWTREEFRAWADRIAERFGYQARFLPVGPEDPAVGPPTQLAVFSR